MTPTRQPPAATEAPLQDPKELLGPPSAGSLCEVCGRPKSQSAGNIPGSAWCWREWEGAHNADRIDCYRLGYEREKRRADMGAAAPRSEFGTCLLDGKHHRFDRDACVEWLPLPTGNAAAQRTPSSSLSEALTGKAIRFLLSCIASGESLSEKEEAEMRRLAAGHPSPTREAPEPGGTLAGPRGRCGYDLAHETHPHYRGAYCVDWASEQPRAAPVNPSPTVPEAPMQWADGPFEEAAPLEGLKDLERAPTARPRRTSCNKHDDCDAAEAAAKDAGKPERYGTGSVRLDHCHDECCEDCFGS